jgi:hypothetical protein
MWSVVVVLPSLYALWHKSQSRMQELQHSSRNFVASRNFSFAAGDYATVCLLACIQQTVICFLRFNCCLTDTSFCTATSKRSASSSKPCCELANEPWGLCWSFVTWKLLQARTHLRCERKSNYVYSCSVIPCSTVKDKNALLKPVCYVTEGPF